MNSVLLWVWSICAESIFLLMSFCQLIWKWVFIHGSFTLSSVPENEIIYLHTIYSSDDNQNKTHDKKEKKMVVQKPHGTMEYTVSITKVV